MTTLVADVPARGQPAYQNGVGGTYADAAPVEVYIPLTGFTISPNASAVVINPAGTLATGTILLPLNPSDGQRFSITSTQTQTALTVTANTNDSIVGGPSALVANTPVVLRYSLYGTGFGSQVAGTNPRTWFRSD
jgi:hypothetical protein